MKKVEQNVLGTPYVMYAVKLADGSSWTTDLMTLMVAADHGLLHPDELDDEGRLKLSAEPDN